MLRASSLAFGYDLDVRAVGDRTVDPGVSGGVAILDFVDALLLRDDADHERRVLQDQVGSEGLVDASGVFANFQMMNRLAEGTGIPVPGAVIDREADLIEALGLHSILKN